MFFSPRSQKTTAFSHRPVRRSKTRGAALPEMTSTLFVTALVMTLGVNLMNLVGKTATRRQTEAPLAAAAALSVGEITAQLRGGNVPVASQMVSGTTYTTSASSIVVSAPGFDPAVSSVKLSGVSDFLVFDYNASTKRLTETVAPGTGSVRRARTSFVLGKNVSSATFTYRVRDQYKASAAGTFTPPSGLSGTPTTTPVALVNGTVTTCTYVSGTRTPIVSVPAAGADVEFVYPINPAVSADLAFVDQIDVALVFSALDAKGVSRTITLPGTVRLRNSANER